MYSLLVLTVAIVAAADNSAAAKSAEDFSYYLNYALGPGWPQLTSNRLVQQLISFFSSKFYHPNTIYTGELLEFASLTIPAYAASVSLWEKSRLASYAYQHSDVLSELSEVGITFDPPALASGSAPGSAGAATKSKGGALTFAAPVAALIGAAAVALM